MIKIVETKELRQAFEYAHDTLGPIAAFRVVTELIERDLNQAVWDPHDVVSFGCVEAAPIPGVHGTVEVTL